MSYSTTQAATISASLASSLESRRSKAENNPKHRLSFYSSPNYSIARKMPSKTSSPSTINSLPPELLSKIFAELRTSAFDLLNCMQCKKTWHALAQATLYRYTVLTSTSVVKFTEQCPTSINTDGRITSLTLRLDDVAHGADEDVDAAIRKGNRAAQDVWRALEKLGPRLAKMTKLKTVSVYRPSNWRTAPANGFWIPYSALDSLVQNLPLTCISLGLDVNTSKSEPNVDLCSSIRRTLPQLEYLRLRLPTLCPKIWGRPLCTHDASSTVLKDFPAVAAPHLKQCIINTTLFRPKGSKTISCHMPPDTVAWQQPSWVSLTEYIKALVNDEKAPVIEKLWIYSSVPQVTGDRTSYPTYVRHDVLSNRSFSIPVHDMGTLVKDASFVRLPGEVDTDFVSPVAEINAVVEDFSWQ
ncbi:MAG: hypothetical protein Q9157_003866 [Trypethelium eluteriae]